VTAFLVDTSFLISFAKADGRPNHEVAVRYFREALRRQLPIYLSAIVASEFQVRQDITDLPMRNFIFLPFNIEDAKTAGLLMRRLARDPTDSRAAVKDDMKILAQAICHSITHGLTEDRSTLTKYAQRLREAGDSTVQTILLADGFDDAWFNEGQRGIPGT
jgi:predicted nucleic acid-binding protein